MSTRQSSKILKRSLLKRSTFPSVKQTLYNQLFIITAVALIEIILRRIFYNPDFSQTLIAGVLFAVTVYSAYRYGKYVGVLSAIITSTYNALTYLDPRRPLDHTPENDIVNNAIIAVSFIIISFFVGWLKERVDGLILREKEARIAAEIERERLHNLFMQAPIPIAIMKGPKHRYELSNFKNDQLLGKKIVLGKSVQEQFSKAETQAFIKILNSVYKTGKTFYSFSVPIELNRGKKPEKRYLNLTYQALHDKKGKIEGILGFGFDVTEQMELEQKKDYFISMASHELKTPLTSMGVYSQLLKKRLAKQQYDEAWQFSEKIDQGVLRLNNLVTMLLDVSKISAGKLDFKMEAVDLNALLKETVSLMQDLSQKHDIYIEGKIPEKVNGDANRLSQVLINLLTNAIKYSPAHGKIIVSLKNENNKAFVSVQDFGIGIAEKHLGRIFERMYRVPEGELVTYPGLGIGLYISSEIIKRHRGKIWVKSKIGEGSTFSFTLPLV